MASGEHTHHEINYIEFEVTDMAQAQRFYEAAFGWRFNDYGPDYAGIQKRGGGEVGGLRVCPKVATGGSRGGRFKGQDPSVSINHHQENRVEGAEVVYVGKAGGPGKRATLRSRIASLLEFGTGKRVSHWGGRYTRQLSESDVND